jgi:hypothetical protein
MKMTQQEVLRKLSNVFLKLRASLQVLWRFVIAAYHSVVPLLIPSVSNLLSMVAVPFQCIFYAVVKAMEHTADSQRFV